MAGKGGGGAWKVAYADFVTAMMAFFLVMWIVAQSDQAKEAIAHHFNDPFAKESDEEGTAHQRPPRHPAPARSTDKPQHEKEAGGSQSVLLLTHGGERTGVGIVIHFADDSTELDAEAERRVAEIAPLLVGKPQKLELRGHSSRRPLGADSEHESHWKLCYERCLAVMKRLESLGIQAERFRISQAAGFEPLASPDEKFPGGGYGRVEVSLLNETTGAKLAQHGGLSKPSSTKNSPKVTRTRHSSAAADDSHTGEMRDHAAGEPASGHGHSKPTGRAAASSQKSAHHEHSSHSPPTAGH